MKNKFTVTLNVKRSLSRYTISKPGQKGKWCHMCVAMYDDIIGKEVVGKVDFILKKISGKPTDYINPFRIDCNQLEVHDGKLWDYAKTIALLSYAIDTNALKKWAGKNMFSIEMEWIC